MTPTGPVAHDNPYDSAKQDFERFYNSWADVLSLGTQDGIVNSIITLGMKYLSMLSCAPLPNLYTDDTLLLTVRSRAKQAYDVLNPLWFLLRITNNRWGEAMWVGFGRDLFDSELARRQRVARIIYQFVERMYTDIKPACDAFFGDAPRHRGSHLGGYVKTEDGQIGGEEYVVRRAVLMAGLVIIGVCSEKGWKKPSVFPFSPVQVDRSQVGGENVVTNGDNSQAVKEETSAGAGWGKQTMGEFGAPNLEEESRTLAWPATFANTTNFPPPDFRGTLRNHTSFSGATPESYLNDVNSALPVPGAALYIA